uniref:Replication factor A C-terminal domain-containing protein n=1 Tax=Daucus carota subsp. sativus TaxID=79200 RepID=A0A161ZWY5_DAUCS
MLHSVYSCELRVTFFNELAEQLEKQLKHTAEEQVTIIIASAKVNQHEGKNSVRWHKKYKCQVSVKKVEEKTNWYDNVCTSCDEEVNIVEGRFRLATVCNDSTGYLGIVFPDEEIQRITGKNVFDIENDSTQVGDSISFPPLLKAFEKKEFIVTLIIGETNVHNSCNVYLAHAIDEPPEMLGDHVPGEVVPANSKQDSISMNLEETLNRASDSPATEKSTNKQRPRKKTETVPFETEENVKKRKTVKKDIRVRIHAFVPGTEADELAKLLEVGKVYLIENFTVSDYTSDDKFRCVRKEIQIVFDNQTKITPLEEKAVNIEKHVFDFFDLSDLKSLVNQQTYLADVIGVMEKPKPLAKIKNRHGILQDQIKFRIADGSTIVKVTFWDEFAVRFSAALKHNFQCPIIIIIGSARITEWSNEPTIANASPTSFYLNCDHRNVAEFRKRLSSESFPDMNLDYSTNATLDVYKVQSIKEFKEDQILKEVLCQVKIRKIQNISSWFVNVCTSCYKETQLLENSYQCKFCDRKCSYPDKKFQVCIFASDDTGAIDIMLEDREVRTVIGKSVFNIIDEGQSKENLPVILKSMENKDYTIKLLIKKENITEDYPIYSAEDIMEGFKIETDSDDESTPHPIEQMQTQPSASSYHLDSLSGISYTSKKREK